MLILSRKVEQEILIGEDIKLTVVRMEGNRVRIGISAPREVPVLRGELAGDANADVSAETVLTRRDMAFAHPPAKRPVGRLCRTASQPAEDTTAAASQPAEDTTAEVADQRGDGGEATWFRGTVAADGARVQLSREQAAAEKPAPLAGFVAAT